MSDTEYAKILNFYYRNYNKCPKCHKNIKDNTQHAINIKCLECGYIINITLSEYINLYQKLSEISTDKSKILSEINNMIDLVNNVKERQTKFASLKSEYLKIDKDTDRLQGILKLQSAKLDEMKAEQFNIFNDLLEIYFQRKNIFRDIKSTITTTNKDILMEVYKNEGLVKEKRLKELAKQTKMTESDIKNWLKWFDLVVQYGKKNKALHDLIVKIDNTKMEYQNNNYNYLIKPFKIKEFKSNLPHISKKTIPDTTKKATPATAIQEKTIKVIKEEPTPIVSSPPLQKIVKEQPPLQKIVKESPPLQKIVKEPTPMPPIKKRIIIKKKIATGGGNSDSKNVVGGLGNLTGRTITIDPYSNTMTWESLEGLEHIDIEKI